jgi:hypothetical protein
MVDEISNKRTSMLVFSSIFSISIFFFLYAWISEVLRDYTGKVVTSQVESTANFIFLIFALVITGVVIISNLLSNVSLSKSVASGFISFLIVTIVLSVISYISLTLTRPEIFIVNNERLPLYVSVLKFSELDTKFVVYVLNSVVNNTSAVAMVYFFIVTISMIITSFIFTTIMKGFKE